VETLCNLTQVLAGFGKWCPLIWEYTGAFATRRLGAIAPAKRLRIVTELARLWETGIFAVDKKRYRITRDGIVQGLRTVCDLEKFGFKNHNYLKRVLMPDAERISAEGLTAGEEARREEDRRQTTEDRGQKEEPRMTPEALAQFKEKMGVSKLSELMHPARLTKREKMGK